MVTFSGHGISFQRDSVAVIPECQEVGLNGCARFINISGVARKFAEKHYSINIFILNMCQEILDPTIEDQSKSIR